MEETRQKASPEKNYQSELEELHRRATKDYLSGLLNRAAMERHIKKRLEAMDAEDNCAMFIVDLDDFKKVNDTLGHMTGDQAIRRSAHILSDIFRATDIVGRLGGDEFAVFLCGKVTEKLVRDKAAEICEKVYLALGDDPVIDLTASVGVYLSGPGQSFEGLYQSADLALYKAKKAGKHRFCLKNHESYQDEREEDFRPASAIQLSGLLEKLGSGVALLEMGRIPQIIYASQSFCRIIKAEYKSFAMPKPIVEFIHPDDIAIVEQAIFEGVEKGQVVESTHRVAAADGSGWLWWHIRATQFEYTGPNPVMLITATDVTEFKESEIRLDDMNRRLKAAFEQTTKRMWEVDVPTGVFKVFSSDGTYRTLGEHTMYFPDSLIDGGWIHPDSVAEFRIFAKELLEGSVKGYGNFAIKNKDTGFYGWAAISYRMLFDEVGRAVRAVGVLEDIPQNFGIIENLSFVQRPLPEGLVADLIAHMCVNLDTDSVKEMWVEGSNLTSQAQKIRCSQVLQIEKQKIFTKEDQKRFAGCFERDSLVKMFESGQRWKTAEYRRVDSGGNIRWVRHVIYLIKEPKTGQLYMFAYLIRLDAHYNLLRAVSGQVKRDPVSHLYDRVSIKLIADELFKDRQGGNRAVAVLQIDGISEKYTDKELRTDKLYFEVSGALSLAFGGGCVLGHYSDNQIILVFPSVTEKEDLRRRMEEAVAYMRHILEIDKVFDSLRFITGISLLPSKTANYDIMLAQALHVCDFWWNSAVDTVEFIQESNEFDARVGADEKTDMIAVYGSESRPHLSESEKDAALDGVSTMLAAKTLDASLSGVLQTIGMFYHADRVYVLMLVEDRNSVVMTFEWTNADKRSIQQTVSGMRLERFPLLERCMKERTPVFLTRRRSEDSDESGMSKDTWSFTAFPLFKDERIEGFLCIENAREHPKDVALLSTLIPYMLLERERFRGNSSKHEMADEIMGMPDLRAFMGTVYTLNSEKFSSLGVVCIDIPSFASINGSYGFEYGSKMLWYVIKTLTDLFGSQLLFRTWDAEFIIFFPNTTKEVFLGRCGRLRSILQRRYPKQIRVGRAWSDGTFTGNKLVTEAKSAMRVESTELIEEERLYEEPAPQRLTVDGAISDGMFTVYFQPKINMETGALAGAEALVRGIDKDGSIVPPVRFIDLLEERGMIRNLDLFVMEQALVNVENWRASGYGVVPVSVNLSRVTAAHASTLASVLAVQSHFPDIPVYSIELEITERGDMDTTEFGKIVDEFRYAGFKVGLDDFGSKYANLSLFTGVRFDTVKLDRSLINGIDSNPVSRALVQDIVKICHTYNMKCVAEGIETEEQKNTLLGMGCRYAQGYYFGKPMSAEEFELKYLKGKKDTGSVQRRKTDE